MENKCPKNHTKIVICNMNLRVIYRSKIKVIKYYANSTKTIIAYSSIFQTLLLIIYLANYYEQENQ